MFITRKRLEEIKSETRWQHESKLNRDRELSELRIEVYELKRRLDILEGKGCSVPNVPVTNSIG